jgi:cell division septal protein FtsQ
MRMKRQANYTRFVRAAAMTVVAGIALAGIVLACILIYDAPGLRISHIYVRGCEAGIAEEVLANAEPYRSKNIVAADLRSLRSLIESNAWIEQAVIRRQYPDTLEIAVRVRTARALITLDEPYLVDANGIVFTRATEHYADLPVMCGLQRHDFEQDPAAAERMVHEGLQIIEALQVHALPLDENVRITCSRELGYTLQTEPDGPEIYLGFDDYQYKLSALPRMLDDLRSRGLSARSIYLHSQERAFVKLDQAAGRTPRTGRAPGADLPT